LPRKETPPPESDPGLRNMIVAAVLLVGVLGLLVEQRLGPTPGYSLTPVVGGLQLSP
jgi:hypothetical protein